MILSSLMTSTLLRSACSNAYHSRRQSLHRAHTVTLQTSMRLRYSSRGPHPAKHRKLNTGNSCPSLTLTSVARTRPHADQRGSSSICTRCCCWLADHRVNTTNRISCDGFNAHPHSKELDQSLSSASYNPAVAIRTARPRPHATRTSPRPGLSGIPNFSLSVPVT